ncbi:MAG: peptide deformylase [Gemmatimonadota bacterium]
MSVLSIHLLGSPVLRTRSPEEKGVTDDTEKLIADMFETMRAAKGVGLAANQVGQARRIAVVEAEDQSFVMINPVIVESAGRDSAEEGCLSIPEIFGDVTRPERVVLEAMGRDGQPFRLEATGLVARAIQHELDHLDGILFLDHLSPMKRKVLISRWKREHDGEGYIKTIVPEPDIAD